MTTSPLAWRNGRFLPAAELTVPVHDAGFVLGATISEQLRTFRGSLFRLDKHLDRFAAGLSALAIKSPFSLDELAAAARELAARNYPLLPAGGDLGLCLFATPGNYATLAGDQADAGPTVAMHTYPLPFHLWSDKYDAGHELVIASGQQIPAACWPRGVKHRSRLHYYLADQEAAARRPGARALLLDDAGHVNETATANVLAYFPGRGLVSPPLECILPGISLRVTQEIAAKQGIPWVFESIEPVQLLDAADESATEILLTSTPWCLLPVTSLDGVPIGDGRPGLVYRRLLEGWNNLVGLDVAAQAKHAPRPA